MKAKRTAIVMAAGIMLPMACLASAVGAQTESAKDTVTLSGVTVVGTHKSDVALTPMDVKIVNSETINKSTESSLLPVLMTQVPGLFVSERGFEGYGVSGGAAGSVSIRGVGGGNKVLFMIDGMPQFAGIFGHALPDTYVANGVERVEIVKGPSSLLYGSNAMGGSVNIITRNQHEDGVSGRARAMFGSFMTQKFNLSTGVKKGGFSAYAGGQLDRSDGYRANSEFWLANEYLNAQYSFNSHWRAGGNVDMTQSKANNPGTEQSPLESMWTKIFRGTASVYAYNSYDNYNGGVQAYINWGRHKVDDGHAPGAAPKAYLFNSTDYNIGFSLFQTLNLWQANDLSAGVDFVHWGGHSWNTPKEATENFNDNDFKACENEVAAYLMMQQGFISDMLSVNAGVRYQHSSQYGDMWVPQAGLIYRPAKMSEIKFSFSKGFRAPNLRELYLYAPKNPDLKPEWMLNYELSYRQHFLDGRLMAGASVYYIDGKDMIQPVMVDGRMKNMNTGKFKNLGFELEASFRINSLWNVSANYAYLHSDNGDILYAPKNKLNAQVTYSPRNFEFTLEDASVWALNNGNPDGTVSYTLLNFRAAYTLGSRVPVTFFAKVDNITNKHYEVVYGCPMPGTTIMGGAEFKF